GQVHRGQPEFHAIDKQPAAAKRKAGGWVTRPSLIQPKSPMGVPATSEQTLSQGDHRRPGTVGLRWLGTGIAGGKDPGVSKYVLQSHSDRPREDELLILGTVFAEGVIGGILDQDAAEIRF